MTVENVDDRDAHRCSTSRSKILAAARSGEPVHPRGEHYTVDGMRFLPRPVQRPGVPLWVAAFYGKPRPLRRAARHQRFFPVNSSSPSSSARSSPSSLCCVRRRARTPLTPTTSSRRDRPAANRRPTPRRGATALAVGLSVFVDHPAAGLVCRAMAACVGGLWPVRRPWPTAQGTKKGCAIRGFLPRLSAARREDPGGVSRCRSRGRRARFWLWWALTSTVVSSAWSVRKLSRLSAPSVGLSMGRMNSQRAVRSASLPAGRASRRRRAMRSEPSALVRVTPSGSSTTRRRSVAIWAMPRSGRQRGRNVGTVD